MNAAIYYHPEAYTTSGPQLMGRNAAGESFLKALLSHGRMPEFWIQTEQQDHARHFAQAALTAGRSERVKAVSRTSLSALSNVGALYIPGPGLAEHAWHRAATGHDAWSLCGITHTTSSAFAMDALAELLVAPLQSWDALICTSTAVKANVLEVLQGQVNYLKERLGISRVVLPELPVIPLGIHTEEFRFSSKQREEARQRLQLVPDTVAVLYVGRLSFHAKAHPLAMYQALQLAAEQTGKHITLLECGWHANDSIAAAYRDAANVVCPSVTVINLDGRVVQDRSIAWAAADVFCSLSDNIQETFGIVPIEAMAAGLPVVISDWDGYKDSVRDGIDGFRIPTIMPQAGLGGDLAYRHAIGVDSYDMYCGHACSVVAVDVAATAEALARLVLSPELRRGMGAAGRSRAESLYDWKHIIPRYEDLWSSLAEQRKGAGGLSKSTNPWPARPDPFRAFARYPTQQLKPDTRLALVDPDADIALRRTIQYRKLAMVNFAHHIIPLEVEIEAVLKAAEAGPCQADQLVADLPPERRSHVFRALLWLLKLHVLRVVG